MHLRVGVIARDSLVQSSLLREGEKSKHHFLHHLVPEAVAISCVPVRNSKHYQSVLTCSGLLGECKKPLNDLLQHMYLTAVTVL